MFKTLRSRIVLASVLWTAGLLFLMHLASVTLHHRVPMREERRQAAETKLAELSSVVHEMSGETPMLYVREGDAREALLALLDEEPAISILVLGAGTGRGGPGPLVTELAGKYAGQLRVPLTIAPAA